MTTAATTAGASTHECRRSSTSNAPAGRESAARTCAPLRHAPDHDSPRGTAPSVGPLVATLSGLMLIGACSSHLQGPGGACSSPADCEPNLLCLTGRCSIPCNRDRDCLAFEYCDHGVCLLVADPACTEARVCTSPPRCHEQAGAGCVAGLCQYQPSPAGTPCDDGNACTTTDLCDASGTCLPGVADRCLTPPSDECVDDDSILRTYLKPGLCDPRSGRCQYELREIPCAACTVTCLPACEATACTDFNGGCRSGGYCDPRDHEDPCVYTVRNVDGAACWPADALTPSGTCDAGECLRCTLTRCQGLDCDGDGRLLVDGHAITDAVFDSCSSQWYWGIAYDPTYPCTPPPGYSPEPACRGCYLVADIPAADAWCDTSGACAGCQQCRGEPPHPPSKRGARITHPVCGMLAASAPGCQDMISPRFVPAPRGSDPFGHCAERPPIDCSGRFYGWIGSTCHLANAAQLDACDGDSACLGSAVCDVDQILSPGLAVVSCGSISCTVPGACIRGDDAGTPGIDTQCFINGEVTAECDAGGTRRCGTDGYCLDADGQYCLTDAECYSGHCDRSTIGPEVGRCCATGECCNSDGDCPDSWGCDNVSYQCLTACYFDADCKAGAFCRQSTSTCVDGAAGAPCDDGGDCISGVCLPAAICQ